MSKSYMMDPNSDKMEWTMAWDMAVPGNDKEQEEEGEGWQYMGSSDCKGVWAHSFRHRCHEGKRAYRWVPASKEFVAKMG